MEYYTSRTKRLLNEFDTTVNRVSDLFAQRYGQADAAAIAWEAGSGRRMASGRS